MTILGLSAFIHDSAACLIRDGVMLAHAEEERFDRHKHTSAFPTHSIEYVLKAGGCAMADVDLIAFNWNPKKSLIAEIIKLVRFPKVYFKVLKHNRPPKNFRSIIASFQLRHALFDHSAGQFRGKIVWVEHHLAHAASSYYLSPFSGQDADVVIVDGHGDTSSTSVYSVKGNQFLLQWCVPIVDSLGILYTNFTHFLGFESYQEGKTMALASFGRDTFRALFQDIVRLGEQGRYTISDKKYLGLWCYFDGSLSSRIGTHREKNGPLEQRHFDMAFSMQNRIKEAILHLIRHLASQSDNRNLALAGGVFLNCDINRDLLAGKIYERIFVPPFTSDSGGAAGAALYAAFALGNERPAELPWFSPYLGPGYGEAEIEQTLAARHEVYEKPTDHAASAARDLYEQKIIGWFQGRMECGPRALGNRSILAAPTSAKLRDHLNSGIKKREYFRPLAPIVTEETATQFFDISEPLSELFRYMLVTVAVRVEYREQLPGITHVDGTARIQVVRREWNPELHQLLVEFAKLSGFAVLINTSFNRQEPIVCSPTDALDCFHAAGLDALYLGNFLVRKKSLSPS